MRFVEDAEQFRGGHQEPRAGAQGARLKGGEKFRVDGPLRGFFEQRVGNERRALRDEQQAADPPAAADQQAIFGQSADGAAELDARQRQAMIVQESDDGAIRLLQGLFVARFRVGEFVFGREKNRPEDLRQAIAEFFHDPFRRFGGEDSEQQLDGSAGRGGHRQHERPGAVHVGRAGNVDFAEMDAFLHNSG